MQNEKNHKSNFTLVNMVKRKFRMITTQSPSLQNRMKKTLDLGDFLKGTLTKAIRDFEASQIIFTIFTIL